MVLCCSMSVPVMSTSYLDPMCRLGSVKGAAFSPFGKELLTCLTFFWERDAHSVNLFLGKSCLLG